MKRITLAIALFAFGLNLAGCSLTASQIAKNELKSSVFRTNKRKVHAAKIRTEQQRKLKRITKRLLQIAETVGEQCEGYKQTYLFALSKLRQNMSQSLREATKTGENNFLTEAIRLNFHGGTIPLKVCKKTKHTCQIRQGQWQVVYSHKPWNFRNDNKHGGYCSNGYLRTACVLEYHLKHKQEVCDPDKEAAKKLKEGSKYKKTCKEISSTCKTFRKTCDKNWQFGDTPSTFVCTRLTSQCVEYKKNAQGKFVMEQLKVPGFLVALKNRGKMRRSCKLQYAGALQKLEYVLSGKTLGFTKKVQNMQEKTSIMLTYLYPNLGYTTHLRFSRMESFMRHLVPMYNERIALPNSCTKVPDDREQIAAGLAYMVKIQRMQLLGLIAEAEILYKEFQLAWNGVLEEQILQETMQKHPARAKMFAYRDKVRKMMYAKNGQLNPKYKQAIMYTSTYLMNQSYVLHKAKLATKKTKDSTSSGSIQVSRTCNNLTRPVITDMQKVKEGYASLKQGSQEYLARYFPSRSPMRVAAVTPQAKSLSTSYSRRQRRRYRRNRRRQNRTIRAYYRQLMYTGD